MHSTYSVIVMNTVLFPPSLYVYIQVKGHRGWGFKQKWNQ